MRTSSTPVQIFPSASTTTSSGALPGTGMTVNSAGPKSGSGSTGGGCQRTGATGGVGGAVMVPPRRSGVPAELRLPEYRFAAQGLEQTARFVEHAVHDLVDGVEFLLSADQRRRQLHDWVAAVIGAAVQAGLEQRRGQEAAE